MYYNHLSHDNKRLYNQTIVRSHRRRIELHVLDLNGNRISSLTPQITTGQITVDVEQTPMMVATLSFVDTARALVFEPDQPTAAPLHRKYMVRILDCRYIPTLGWVDHPVFTGPIWDFERQGALVTITANSVDRLASGDIRRAKMWRRKTKKTDIIKGLLQEAGSVNNRIPDLSATTVVHVHVGTTHPKKKGQKPHKTRRATGFEVTRQETYWDKASGLADSMNRLLFPTGSGAIEMRPHPERPIYHFNHALLADVDLKRAAYDGPNTWLVTGAKPKGSKRRVSSGLVGFPKAHPLSAYSLAWNGKPNQILDESQNAHCKTKKECRAIAIRKRDRAMRLLVDVTFDALPIPWLRPWDIVTAQAGWGVPAVHIKQLTYPLSPDTSPMTVGAVRLAVPRHHHHGGHR